MNNTYVPYLSYVQNYPGIGLYSTNEQNNKCTYNSCGRRIYLTKYIFTKYIFK